MRDCTFCVAKTKALISFAVTAKLIYVFVFAYAKSRLSHDAAHYDLFQPGQIIDIRAMINEATRMNVEEGAQDSHNNVGINF